jgi:anti-sigma factor RsiW
MDCRHVEEMLSPYLDGELPPELRGQVAAHLQGCPACRRELALLTRLEEVLGELPAPAPAPLAERVLAALPPRPRPWWQSLALAASLILGIVLGGALARDFYPLPPGGVNGGDVLALEDFQDFPQGSWGSVLLSYQDEANGA